MHAAASKQLKHVLVLHIILCFVGTGALVLQPSCNLAALPLVALQPLTILRSLQLPCAPCESLYQCGAGANVLPVVR
jgi:hypothetical protein